MNIFKQFLTRSIVFKPNYFSTQISQSILNLDDLKCELTIEDKYLKRYWNVFNYYCKHYEYFDKNTKMLVCQIAFEIKPNVGNICLCSIHPEYRHKTLAIQIDK